MEIRGSENIYDYPEIETRVAGIEMQWPAALINVRDERKLIIEGGRPCRPPAKGFLGLLLGLKGAIRV